MVVCRLLYDRANFIVLLEKVWKLHPMFSAYDSVTIMHYYKNSYFDWVEVEERVGDLREDELCQRLEAPGHRATLEDTAPLCVVAIGRFSDDKRLGDDKVIIN